MDPEVPFDLARTHTSKASQNWMKAFKGAMSVKDMMSPMAPVMSPDKKLN